MYGHIAIIVVIAAFVWQMQISFSGNGRKRLLLPAMLVGCASALALFAWIGNALGMPSAPFGAAILAILILIPLVGTALAWLIYGIVRLVQKRRK